jgi:hypothetical protein
MQTKASEGASSAAGFWKKASGAMIVGGLATWMGHVDPVGAKLKDYNLIGSPEQEVSISMGSEKNELVFEPSNIELQAGRWGS